MDLEPAPSTTCAPPATLPSLTPRPPCAPTRLTQPASAITTDDTTDDDATWTSVGKAKKRRKAPGSGSDSGSSTHTVAQAPPPQPRIPPIVIASYKNWQQLLRSLGIAYEAKFIGNLLHITVTSIGDFRSLQKLLREKNVPFHTFTPPAEKEIKVTLRGLPHDTPPDDIKIALENEGFAPGHITPLTRRDPAEQGRRLPANTFLVKIKKAGNWDQIWQLQKLLSVRISIDKFRPPRGIAQCYNCQRFGHASENCNLPSRCLKCGEDRHLARDCQNRQAMTGPKCCNCGGPHPANYRGCPSHKNAQAALRRRTAPPPPPIARQAQHVTTTAPRNTRSVSYAAAVTGAGHLHNTTPATSTPPSHMPRIPPAATTSDTNNTANLASTSKTQDTSPTTSTDTITNPGPSSKVSNKTGHQTVRNSVRKHPTRPHPPKRRVPPPSNNYTTAEDSEYEDGNSTQTDNWTAPYKLPRNQPSAPPQTKVNDRKLAPSPPITNHPTSAETTTKQTTSQAISPAAIITWLAKILPIIMAPGTMSQADIIATITQSLTTLINNE